MALGLLMAGLVPTSGMTISWTGFAKGNVAAAIKMTVIGLTLGSIATPFYVRALMGAALEVDIMAVIRQIVVIVFIPMIAGYFTQQALVKNTAGRNFNPAWRPAFPALSTVGVLGIVFVAMALKAKAVAGAPELLLSILAPLAIIYTFNFLLSTIVGRLFLPRGRCHCPGIRIGHAQPLHRTGHRHQRLRSPGIQCRSGRRPGIYHPSTDGSLVCEVLPIAFLVNP
jgi:ACR3 family arsenite transporter